MDKSLKIGIIHYGCGNIYNVKKSLKKIGFSNVTIIENGTLDKFDILILPGVGSFKNAMDFLIKKNYDTQIKEHINKGKKLLGICLGMQLLMRSSQEFENTNGLNILKGKVVNLRDYIKNDVIPHVGFNSINIKELQNKTFYFDHSYKVILEDKQDIIVGQSNYSDHDFVSYIRQNQIVGVQFHPELSANNGLTFLTDFLTEGN